MISIPSRLFCVVKEESKVKEAVLDERKKEREGGREGLDWTRRLKTAEEKPRRNIGDS